MAKPINLKRDSKYMKQQKDRFGENWLAVKNSKDLYNDMPRILRELSKGEIDLDQFGYMFLSNQMLTAVIQYVGDQLTLLHTMNVMFTTHYNVAQGNIDPYQRYIIETVNLKIQMYDYIYSTFQIVARDRTYTPLRRLQTDLSTTYRGLLQNSTQI